MTAAATTALSTMNDYERRFQRSLQKLTIPKWYNDTIPSSKTWTDSKESIISTSTITCKTDCRESIRTPEIMHVRRPHSYRSCRSSLATSPSPSVHSWHPNHIIDGMNFSLLIPSSSSSSSSRRHNKYQKGIERVSKSSRWYQPTQFMANKPTKDQTTGIIKVSTTFKEYHYDTPKIDENIKSQSICLVTNSDVKETIVDEQNNNKITNVKQQDNHIKSDESQIMPLVNLKEPFSQIELEEIPDEDDDKQLLSNKQINNNELLERTANDLVESVLADILLIKTLDDNNDDVDQNSGVRELSEDENGLRELDEDDMNDTDEFIVFATQSETSNDNQIYDSPRYNLNKLYTFSKQTSSNQNSPRSIIENNLLATHLNDEQPFDKLFHISPIYHTQYTDKIMSPSNCQLATHQSSDGVNEETARIGRLLLNRISIPLNENIHNLSQTSTSTPSKLKNTRFIVSEQDDYQRQIIEEYDDEFHDKVRRDSAYSSNQERIHIQQSIYEPLSECYSGYTFIQSDFLTPNLSSIQSTTDEAYESEPTTMSSSIATTTHVHPDLEHEFDYPSPPPPVPDRRLKPAYLKASSPPSTKPQSNKQDNIDSIGYSIVQKISKPLPVTTIEQFLRSTSNDSTSISAKTMSSRHYCGSIPVSNEQITQSSIKTNEQSKTENKEKRSNRTLNCLHPSTTDDNQKRNLITKSSSSLNKTKIKKQKLIKDFDEVTNGLAIRLPAPISKECELSKTQNLNKTSTLSSTKRSNVMTNKRPSFYETSV